METGELVFEVTDHGVLFTAQYFLLLFSLTKQGVNVTSNPAE